jgi:hypothetical protein
MAENAMALYTAVYESVPRALEDLDVIEQLHKESLIRKYDAAGIDQEQGKPHIVKRMDHLHIRVIPEMFGGGALPRKELKEAAQELTADQAGLIVIGEPTIGQRFDEAVRRAAKIVKRERDATTDASELKDALKS